MIDNTAQENNFSSISPPNLPANSDTMVRHNKKRFLIYFVLCIGCLVFLGTLLILFGVLPINKDITGTKNIVDSKITNKKESNPKIKILASLPPEDPAILYNVIFDPQETSVVYTSTRYQDTASSSATTVVNGTIGKTYDQIFDLTVSPNGKRIAFTAEKDNKMFVVVDGVEGKQYDYIRSLKFSPNSEHVAYAVGEGIYMDGDRFGAWLMGRHMFIVVDGTESKKYDGTYVDASVSETYDPFFSQDGKKVTYTAIKDGTYIIVIDDRELSEFPRQQYPQFLADSYDIVYLGITNNKYSLVVAGEKRITHDYITYPLYVGKNTSQIAYQISDSDKYVIVYNDLSYPVLSGVLEDLVFSDSGKYVAYYTGTGISKELSVNGEVTVVVQPNANTAISHPVFSPDENFLAYSEFDENGKNAAINVFSVNPLKKVISFPLSGFRGLGQVKFSADSTYVYVKGWQNRNIVFVTLNVKQMMQNAPK